MQQLKDILNQLRFHGVTPSEKLYQKIWTAIKSVRHTEEKSEEEFNFSELKEHQITPPNFLFNAILEQTKISTQTPAKVIPLRNNWKMKIAASFIGIALIVAAIWKMAKPTISENTVPTIAKNISTKESTINLPDSIINFDKNAEKEVGNIASTNSSPAKYKTNTRNINWVDVEGKSYPAENNDLFALFTNFNYNNLPFFLNEENTQAVNIRIDKSSSIVLSEGMMSMLKQSYQHKRNGKLTHRAKKEKRKLQRWKADDAKYFDKSLDRNPMNPISLAEFVF